MQIFIGKRAHLDLEQDDDYHDQKYLKQTIFNHKFKTQRIHTEFLTLDS